MKVKLNLKRRRNREILETREKEGDRMDRLYWMDGRIHHRDQTGSALDVGLAAREGEPCAEVSGLGVGAYGPAFQSDSNSLLHFSVLFGDEKEKRKRNWPQKNATDMKDVVDREADGVGARWRSSGGGACDGLSSRFQRFPVPSSGQFFQIASSMTVISGRFR
jgi:hypothetical protein